MRGKIHERKTFVNHSKKFITLLLVFLAMWLGLRYLLPLVFPLLLGALIALAAEPVVRLLSRRLGLRRGFAAGLGVTAAILLFLGFVVLIASFFVKELGQLAGAMPDMEQTVRRGLTLLQDFLLSLASRAPDGIQPYLNQTVLDLFSSGTALLDRVTQWAASLVSGFLSRVPDGFLSTGTAIISAFMISARLPKIKAFIRGHIPAAWREKYLPALKAVRRSVGGWLKAQLRLSLLTLVIVTIGLLVLQVPYAPLWAIGISLVDAVPILGTGTVMLPWALVCFLQGNTLRAIGLVCTYAVAALSRSVLEPRLVGRQLGLDPLVTLAALYAGYQLWGIGGMILSPMLAVAAMQFAAGTANKAPDK